MRRRLCTSRRRGRVRLRQIRVMRRGRGLGRAARCRRLGLLLRGTREDEGRKTEESGRIFGSRLHTAPTFFCCFLFVTLLSFHVMPGKGMEFGAFAFKFGVFLFFFRNVIPHISNTRQRKHGYERRTRRRKIDQLRPFTSTYAVPQNLETPCMNMLQALVRTCP